MRLALGRLRRPVPGSAVQGFELRLQAQQGYGLVEIAGLCQRIDAMVQALEIESGHAFGLACRGGQRG